ncbi:CLUMA_CG014529, isoform A [Clunio marinus]|uniref:CLUMA_CG014529, isoform A n=1 Tax=Clunio marinus TaxID=568069 RepID=A0A1J1IN40_9DIPT|nr:CLUMA_CG014529, isoform A [Clunio marinus]
MCMWGGNKREKKKTTKQGHMFMASDEDNQLSSCFTNSEIEEQHFYTSTKQTYIADTLIDERLQSSK